MAVRRRKFSPPTIPSRSQRRSSVRQEIIEPVAGFESRTEPQFMSPGQTPKSKNFIHDHRRLRPRSGLSQFGALPYSSTSTAFTTGHYVDSASGEEVQIAAFHWPGASSGSNISFFRKDAAAAWAGVGVDSDNSMKIDERYGDFAEVYVAGDILGGTTQTENTKLIVFTTEGEPGYYGRDNTGNERLNGIGSEPNPIGNAFTYFDSGASSHHYVESFDDRLIFFNEIDSSNDTFSTRVRWSARGQPLNFTEGGFEDLASMRGTGTGLVAQEDRLVLFSDQDVWIGTPRRDAYAFDFDPLSQEVGCPHPRTIAQTSAGLIWLGQGFQFYLLAGGQIHKIGKEIRPWLQENVGFGATDRAWGAYDRSEQQYQFHFRGDEAWYLDVTTLRPDRRDPDHLKGVWFYQDYGDYELLHGVQTRTQATFSSEPAWKVLALSSDLTPYTFDSNQTSDDGTLFECFWRSHAMRPTRRADDFQFEAFTDFWIDYDAAQSGSSVTVFWDENENLMDIDGVQGNNEKHPESYLSNVKPGLAHIPLTSEAHRFPMFEIRMFNNQRRTKISRIQTTLRAYTGKHRG